MPTLDRPNARWSMDFVSDQLINGRRFRLLTVVDDCTRESRGVFVDFSFSGQRVSRCLWLGWVARQDTGRVQEKSLLGLRIFTRPGSPGKAEPVPEQA